MQLLRYQTCVSCQDVSSGWRLKIQLLADNLDFDTSVRTYSPSRDLSSVAVGAQMAIWPELCTDRQHCADSADALHTTDDDGRKRCLNPLGYARDVSNASGQLISQIVRP